MSYRLSRQADQDLIDIYLNGATQFGPMQAERYLSGLIALFDLIAANPGIARERKELRPPMRLHPYGAHLVVYAVQDGKVQIVRILHGRQDWERRLS